jgi:Domain of unknown function (DUF6791)/ThiF family
MSLRLISRSPDLQKLQDEGYELEISSSHLLVHHVPFRNQEGAVAYGTLVSGLELAGDVTVRPQDHRAWFVGGIPHGADGRKLRRIINNESKEQLAAGLVSSCMFSTKPLDGRGYRDYRHKMVTHISLISAAAKVLDERVTAKTFPVIIDDDEDSVFNYIDTASSRAGISAATEKLKVGQVAIIGLGGSGSYILDFLAKTPVGEIHIFDGDLFLQHNAFRSPGAPSAEELREKRMKVDHHARSYSHMRKGIIVHDYFIDSKNVDELKAMDFVFVAADSAETKMLLAAKLGEFGVPFVDVGMGLYEVDGSLGGVLRTTTATPETYERIDKKKRISAASGGGDDPYAQNIQIAELNAMNAAFAVIKWKKLVGFYLDDEQEHHSLYVIGGNEVINDDRAGDARAPSENFDEEAA